jgi:hypothetical protein
VKNIVWRRHRHEYDLQHNVAGTDIRINTVRL